MLISMAYAQEVAIEAVEAMPEAPSTADAFAWNMGLILVLVIMFYVLLIRPQQKRMAQHNAMLNELKKGDKVVTAGGLVGKIDKLKDDSEVEVDLGNGVKVTALRHTITAKVEKENTLKK
jgi:preprotein translocase subunit YajC